MSKGEFVDEAGYVSDGQVVVRLRIVRADVVAILRRGCVALERSARVVERVSPCKRVEQSEPIDDLLLVFLTWSELKFE